MKLTQILEILHKISEMNPGISEPMVCGGIPRDKVIGTAKNKYNDLDITTGDASVIYLAEEFSRWLSRKFEIKKHTAKDGHMSVDLANLKVDFSSNFVNPEIDKLLSAKGINNPTDLQKEMFSRDFTCNALLLKFNLRDIVDPTGRGLADIKDKVIRTCLDPHSTFSVNPERISRVYYVAAKTGFDVDPTLIQWIKNNPNYFKAAPPKYVMDKISKAMEYDPEKTTKLLEATNGWQFVPELRQGLA